MELRLAEARAVASRFARGAAGVAVEPFAGGHINASFLVTVGSDGAAARLLLQRLNEHVFRRPELVIDNVERVVRHLAAQGDDERRTLRLAGADDGALHVRGADGAWWRAFAYVEGTITRQAPRTAHDARRAARAVGEFQRRVADLPAPPLHETIPGFHDTPSRLGAFRDAVRRDAAGRAASALAEIRDVERRAPLADALLAAHRRGELPERIVHNDAKIANVLFDAAADEALCVVDLDTVMPGLALYDVGDMVRSMASPAAEDERDASHVVARPDFVAAIARGWLEGAGALVSPAERALIVTAAEVITYEQAIRFLADHLDGDRYYRITRPDQNLDRARTQLALLASLEAQHDDLEARIDALAGS